MELHFGILKTDPARRSLAESVLKRILKKYRSLSFDENSALEAASIRYFLSNQGTPIGPFDLLIAAIARANQLTLVTHNTREFSRIPNLLIEDWQI
jgi:tRNA(fMet)-specific endonuclease VapC